MLFNASYKIIINLRRTYNEIMINIIKINHWNFITVFFGEMFFNYFLFITVFFGLCDIFSPNSVAFSLTKIIYYHISRCGYKENCEQERLKALISILQDC